MNYRYIILSAGNSNSGSGFGSDFDHKFNYNTWFVSNYLSRHVRRLHLPTGGDFNMLLCNITSGSEDVSVHSVATLDVRVHVDKEEIDQYKEVFSERERYEFYLSLLERAYTLAGKSIVIPKVQLMSLHEDFRQNDYKNEWIFKRIQFTQHGIKVVLHNVLSSCDYKLILSVFDLHGELMTTDSIYTTFPDDIFFSKTVRNVKVCDGKLQILDFLDNPQFEFEIGDLAKGIIRTVCLDENTKKYMPNDANRDEFERLKW